MRERGSDGGVDCDRPACRKGQGRVAPQRLRRREVVSAFVRGKGVARIAVEANEAVQRHMLEPLSETMRYVEEMLRREILALRGQR